jgi:hypothetical protein
MMRRGITVLTDVTLITCIVQRGVADTIVRAAVEAGAQGATIHYAHGTGVRERLGILGVAVEVTRLIEYSRKCIWQENLIHREWALCLLHK